MILQFCKQGDDHRWYFITSMYYFTNVVGMSIEKMLRNDEMKNFGIYTKPIPMFFFLKYKTETVKTVQRQLHILHNISKFRHFVTSFLLTCQPHKNDFLTLAFGKDRWASQGLKSTFYFTLLAYLAQMHSGLSFSLLLLLCFSF